MRSLYTDKVEFRSTVVAVAFFVVGFVAACVGIYLLFSLGGMLFFGGIFFMILAIGGANHDPECER